MKIEDFGLRREAKVKTIFTSQAVFAYQNQNILGVCKKILAGYRRIPIVDEKKRIRGIVTTSDILMAILMGENLEKEVSEIMVRDILVCEAGDTLDYLLKLFKFSGRGGLPVLQEEKLIGIVTERDFVKFFDRREFGINVEKAMSRKPLVITLEYSVLDCLKSLLYSKFRRLPVVKNGKILGIVSCSDILRFLDKNGYKFDCLDEPLEKVVVGDVVGIEKEKDLRDAVKLMKEKKLGCLLVWKEKSLEGILTERDVLSQAC